MNQERQTFCTVFDKNYLYQGVTLFRSLQSHISHFTLYCLALDTESVSALKALQFENLIVVGLEALNAEQVNWIRSRTNYPQFCWSMQPLICRYVLDLGEPSVTYLEADSWFFSNPQPIFDELKGFSVSLAPHFYSPQFQNFQDGSGIYCTHFNYFKNDDDGTACLEFWRQKNFEYTKDLPQTYPGQSALDLFKPKFSGVAVITHRGAGVAPWNVQQYQVTKNGATTLIDQLPVIFYHYHQLARFEDGKFNLGEYPISKAAIKYLYLPYIRAVLESEKMVREKDPNFNFKRTSKNPPKLIASILTLNKAGFRRSIHNLIRKVKGISNVIDPRKELA